MLRKGKCQGELTCDFCSREAVGECDYIIAGDSAVKTRHTTETGSIVVCCALVCHAHRSRTAAGFRCPNHKETM